MEPSSPSQGSIVTFYSYKGGTGRSMMLANVAWLLASRRRRVLVIDWDLEAPGLHRYLLPFLNDKDLTSSHGVIDFIIDFALKATEIREAKERTTKSDEWMKPYVNILRYASALQWDFPSPGAIDFVSAGRQSASYSTRVNSFNWQNFYDLLGGGSFLEAVKEKMRSEYDYILLDSRTGLSDTSGICTVQMPDIIVVCFTLNNQSIEGASTIAKSVFEQRRGTDFRIFPVPTRTDNAELEKRLLRLEYARDVFDSVLDHIPANKREEYWGTVEVPYVPFYSYEEMLAIFRDLPSHLVSLLAPFDRLTGYLTKDFTASVPVIDEQKRESVVGQFANETLINYDIFIAHAREDAEFAEQLARRLRSEKVEGRKLRVTATSWDGDDVERNSRKNESALNRSKKVILIVTPDWLESGDSEAFTLGTAKVVVVYYREAEIPPDFRLTRFVDFRTASDFAAAIDKLLEVIKDPTSNETLPTFEQEISAQLLSPGPQIGFIPRRDREGRNLVDLLKKELSGDTAATVVLWGAGGVGKTTLAAEVMRSLDGLGNRRVIWFSLDDFKEPNYFDVLDGILAKLDQEQMRTFDESRKLVLLRSLASVAVALLVLDGFERISSEAQSRLERDLINGPPCPILITSRRRISLARNIVLSGFSMDETNECIDRWVILRGGKPDLSPNDRSRLYNLTDGIPLALHLVLGRLNLSLDPAEALNILENNSGQTVERAITLAFDSLAKDRDARLVLLALTLFFPSASEDALRVVTGFQKARRLERALSKLKVLYFIDEAAATDRYMLHDAVRNYSQERYAETNRGEALRKRFIDYFVRYALERSGGTSAQYDALDLERDNILNAMAMANAAKDWAIVVKFGRALVLEGKWLVTRGYLDDAIRAAEQALSAASLSDQAEEIAVFATAAVDIRIRRKEYGKAADTYDLASRMIKEPNAKAVVLHKLGELHATLGHYDEAYKYYTQSLNLEKISPETLAANLASLGEIDLQRGNYATALDYLLKALEIAKQSADQNTVAGLLQKAGELAFRLERFQAAEAYFAESLELYKQLKADDGIASVLSQLGRIAARNRKFNKAKKLYNESLELQKKLGLSSVGIARTLHGLGRLSRDEGNFGLAIVYLTESLAIREQLADQRGIAYTLYDLGTVASTQGDLTDARQFYTESLNIFRQLNYQQGVANTLSQLGRVYVQEDNLAEARAALEEATRIFEDIGSPRAERTRAALTELQGKPSKPTRSDSTQVT